MINLNNIYVPNLKDLNDIYNSSTFCKRGRLNTGTRCQANCYFCYYKNQLNAEHLDLNIIKNEIDLLKSSGITEIELSGGESTIHKDFFKILDYIKEVGYEYSSMLSNGIKLADKEFITKCKEHGINEILFSLHGSNAENHNKLLGINSFDKICQAIENANDLGIVVRINCVIDNTFNNHKEYTKLLKRFDIKQVNFLPLNYWDDAKDLDSFSYELSAMDHVKKFIDLNYMNYDINVRYVPLCYMKGYENHCVSTLDHIFDLTDWNIQCFDLKEKQTINLQSMLDTAIQNRKLTYNKPMECKNCEHILRCDGYEK